MRRYFYSLIGLIGLLSLCGACDEGRIYEEVSEAQQEGRVAKLTGDFSDVAQWADGYSVVLAGFEEDNEYAVVAKALPLTDGPLEMSLGGISEKVTQGKLCAVNRLRKEVLEFQSVECADVTTDTIRLEVGALSVGMLDGIQQQLLDKRCVACHGGSTSAAAGLHLTKERSFSALVDQPATTVPGAKRVEPGQAEGSVLYDILSTDMSAAWGIDHSGMLSATPVMLTLIKDWINCGIEGNE